MKTNFLFGVFISRASFGNSFKQLVYFYNFAGRNRWVEYNQKHNLEYDGSMVPAEWFGWLHYKTDTPPTKKPPLGYKWLTDHTNNMSGTPEQYVPFTTTRPKIQTWTPPKPGSSKAQ